MTEDKQKARAVINALAPHPWLKVGQKVGFNVCSWIEQPKLPQPKLSRVKRIQFSHSMHGKIEKIDLMNNRVLVKMRIVGDIYAEYTPAELGIKGG